MDGILTNSFCISYISHIYSYGRGDNIGNDNNQNPLKCDY